MDCERNSLHNNLTAISSLFVPTSQEVDTIEGRNKKTSLLDRCLLVKCLARREVREMKKTITIIIVTAVSILIVSTKSAS